MVIIYLTDHAKMRMQKYNITEREVFEALTNPDEIVRGYRGRLIAHKYKDKYVLRVVFEKKENVIIVVTVYIARRSRYERKR